MYVLICGSREWVNPEPVRDAIRALARDTTVVHGSENFLDAIIEQEAARFGLTTVVCAPIAATEDQPGKLLNDAMFETLIDAQNRLNWGSRCIAFHEKITLGSHTRDMVRRCIRAKIRTSIFLRGHPDFIRASHLTACTSCRRPYIEHPDLISELDNTSLPYLTWVCRGMLVKL